MKEIPGEVIPFHHHDLHGAAGLKNGQRASSADRRKTVDTILANHHAGRLTTQETEARTELARNAVTENELAELVRDIPGVSRAPVTVPYKAGVAGFGALLAAILAGGIVGIEEIAGMPGWTRTGVTAPHVWVTVTGIVTAVGLIVTIVIFCTWITERNKKQKKLDIS